MDLRNVPKKAKVVSLILEKMLKTKMLAEVYLLKYPHHYEAGLFIGGLFKPGPPLPRPLEEPTDVAAYWMGVRPRVGFTQSEGDEILGEVNVKNMINHCYFRDIWGKFDDW